MILHGSSLKFNYAEVYKVFVSILFLLKLFLLTKGGTMVIYADSAKIQCSNHLVAVPCLTGSSSQAIDPIP